MGENTSLEQRVRETSQKAEIVRERIEYLFKSLPAESQLGIERLISEKYAGVIAFSHHIPLQDIKWKVKLYLSIGLHCSINLHKEDVSWYLTNESELYKALANESDWQELIDFIDYALILVRGAFDDIFQIEIEQLNPEVRDLSRLLRETRETCKRHERERYRLYRRVVDLELAIKQSVPQFQKAAQDLKETRSFLGQSKTIKGIRENIEKVVADLCKVAYPDEPPPATL